MRPGTITDYNLVEPAWYEQWYKVRAQLAALEAGCKPDSDREQSSIKEDFEIFFTQCVHVGDWLWGDTTTVYLGGRFEPSSTTTPPCGCVQVWLIRANTTPVIDLVP
jgi:hypothetical protein